MVLSECVLPGLTFDAEVYSPSILAFLTNALSDPGLRLDARQLASCLYGLQGLSTSEADPEVLRLVDVLATITESFRTSKSFTAQAVSNMLYGLQNLSSDFGEVRRLLRSLASLLQDFPAQQRLSAQGVGALYGLQGMGSDAVELRQLLRVLKPLLEAATNLDGQAIGNALYGLQSMKSDALEVRELLEALARKVTAFHGKLTEQETPFPAVLLHRFLILSLFLGLNMNSVVKQLIHAVSFHIFDTPYCTAHFLYLPGSQQRALRPAIHGPPVGFSEGHLGRSLQPGW